MFCVHTLNVHGFTAGALPGLLLLQTAHVAAPLGAQYHTLRQGKCWQVASIGTAGGGNMRCAWRTVCTTTTATNTGGGT
jgi:hypothetical protein